MRSPFPGMDPFLELDEWEDFHTRLNTAISEALSPRIEPRYLVRIERRVYVEHVGDEEDHWRRADVAILLDRDADLGPLASPAAGATATLAPEECFLAMPQEQRETYLVIREQETRQIVTVIETLSPANKRQGGDGRREYLRKREEILQSPTHLVELDLLRAGVRLPMHSRLPAGDYYAVVSRAWRRPRAQIWAWTVRDPLPTILVPLQRGDPDAALDLQTVFTTVYQRARYDLSLDYRRPLTPPLAADDEAGLHERLATSEPE